MGVRKTLRIMDERLRQAFSDVKEDIVTVLQIAQKAENSARGARAQLTQSHYHSSVDGSLKPTFKGRLEAIEKLLGVEYEVKPAKKIPVTVVASTPKKKASKK